MAQLPNMMKIPFNKPYISGKEVHYIYDAVNTGHLSGNGKYTKLCHAFFEERYGFKKTLLTTSCTDALEMCALLLNIVPGDEVIMPSYTFVSTALAFVRQGAIIRFVDSKADHPNIDETKIEALITARTKAIVVVHYSGVACEMDYVMDIAKRHNLFVIEDAAQAINSFYKGQSLGGIGHLGTFSFHESKNIQCGEGGLLAINDERFIARAELLWEKGTNRADFYRGAINKYEWVDIGSSFLPSEVVSAFLYAQLEQLDRIQKRRIDIWNVYYQLLKPLAAKGLFQIQCFPDYSTNNAHIFYLILPSLKTRSDLIENLKKEGIDLAFHYLSLHNSPYYKSKHDGRVLPNSDMFSDCLVRLPLFYELDEVDRICEIIANKIN